MPANLRTLNKTVLDKNNNTTLDGGNDQPSSNTFAAMALMCFGGRAAGGLQHVRRLLAGANERFALDPASHSEGGGS